MDRREVAASRLQLRTRDHDHRLEIELHGVLDVATGPRLITALDAALANPGIHAVQVAARDLRFVDVRGMSALVTARHVATSSGRCFRIADSPLCYGA
ncbi:MAG TPA: STAS domain-containing protein [Acidimicrobiales bacterium]|nr:STAS domain-containing protein [Acidimicrobiales bacterium]